MTDRSPGRLLSWFAPAGWPKFGAAWFLALLLLDLALHGFVLLVEPPPPEQDGYWELSGHTLAGDWFWLDHFIAYRTPVYPAYLAVMRAALGPYAAQGAMVGQHLMIMATSLITAAICGRFTGSGRVVLGAYALSIAGLSRAWYANVLMTETMFTLLLTIVVGFTLSYHRRPTWQRAVTLAVALAITTLTRPITSYLWLVLAGFMVARHYGSRESGWLRKSLLHAGVTVAVTYTLLAPWYVRNARLFGEVFFVQFIGRNIWEVTFRGESGAALPVAQGPASQEFRRRLEQQKLPVDLTSTWGVSNALRRSGLPDDDTDRLMVRVCLEAYPQDWKRVSYLTLRRTVNFWRCISNPIPPPEWRGEPEDYLGQIVWSSARAKAVYEKINQFALARSLRGNEAVTLIVLLGLAGLLWQQSSRAWGLALCGILLYFNLVTSILEIPTYRYRMILEPTLIVAAVCGLFSWYTMLRRNR